MRSVERERSLLTKNALMRAAEVLIAENGIENVAIKDIVAKAGQKNESALQYHFKSINGLIHAIHDQRGQEIQAKRATLLHNLLSESPEPDLGSVCQLMVQPVFDLARASDEFRRYIQAFGHELALAEAPLRARVESAANADGSSTQALGVLLVASLPHLSKAAFTRRLEAAMRLSAASMFHQSRRSGGFRGLQAELFLSSLVDALVGLLSAPESERTAALAQRLKR
ncbi:MAG: helix-turn-helix domain-containing protein [Pseudomonadota bacterium]